MIRKFVIAISALALVTPAFAADNKTAKDAAGASFTLAMKDKTSVFFPEHMCVTLADETLDCFLELNAALRNEDTASADADTGLPIFAVRKATPANTSGADGDYEALQISAGSLWTKDSALNTATGTIADAAWTSGSGSVIALLKAIAGPAVDTNPVAVKTDQTTPGTTDLVHAAGFAGTATTTITRPADTTAYAANDALSDSTSAPTTGGFTLSSMCRASGGSGILTDATFIYSTASAVSGIVFIYDSAPTAQNDNAAWSVSDSDQLKLVGTIPFTTVADAVNAYQNVQNLNMGYTCSGSANLRFMVKITTAYTPAASDTLTLRAKFVQSN